MKRLFAHLLAVLFISCGFSFGQGLNDGLVSYWQLNSDLLDAVDDNHGTEDGGVIPFETGKFGNAIKLDGTQNVIITGGDESEFDFTSGSITVSVWFTAASITTDWQCLIAKGETNAWRLHRLSSSEPPQLSRSRVKDALIAMDVVDETLAKELKQVSQMLEALWHHNSHTTQEKLKSIYEHVDPFEHPHGALPRVEQFLNIFDGVLKDGNWEPITNEELQEAMEGLPPRHRSSKSLIANGKSFPSKPLYP